MIGVGIPATTTARGIGRVATLADMEPGAEVTNGPAFLAAGSEAVTPTPTANAVPQADENGKIDPRWCGTPSRLFASFNTSEPDGLLANGSSYSRTTYARLFAVIGTAFGAGDGSTTFNVPDFRGRTLQGANANLFAVLAAGLPNITGTFDGFPYSIGGAFYSGADTMQFGGNGSQHKTIYFDAHRASSIYGASNTVQSPAIAANIFITF